MSQKHQINTQRLENWIVLFSGEKIMRHLAVGSYTVPMAEAIHHCYSDLELFLSDPRK